MSVAEQIAAKGETNGNAKEQSGIDTVERKEQGKPLSFYLSPEITLAAPTTVTHRPSFFFSLLDYRDYYIGTRKRFLFIGTHFQRQGFPTFFFVLFDEYRRILSAVLFAVFSCLFIFILFVFGAFGFPIAWSTIHRHNRVRSNLIRFFFLSFLPFRCKLGTLCVLGAVGCCLSSSYFLPCFSCFFKKGCLFDSFLLILPPTLFLLFFFCLPFVSLFSASSTRRRSSVAMAPIESDLINL